MRRRASRFHQKRQIRKVPLDGLALGQFVQSPEHKSMFESFGNWNFDYVYIDEKAMRNSASGWKRIGHALLPWRAKSANMVCPYNRKSKGRTYTTVGNQGLSLGH